MLGHEKARSIDRPVQQEVKQHLTSFINNAQSILNFFYISNSLWKYLNIQILSL